MKKNVFSKIQMEGRTLAFSSRFFCMFGNHLQGCFYRNIIVELTFQAWIPIKTGSYKT